MVGKTVYNRDIKDIHGGAKMSRGKTKYEWDKQNSMFVGIKFMNKSDADIIQYLNAQMENGEVKSLIIKAAIREYMTTHPAE